MKKSGWLVLPVAFFLFLNFAVSQVKVLFVSQTVYFLFLILLFQLLRRFKLSQILPPIIGGISFILFFYGIIQKFILFPYYLANLDPAENFYAEAMLARIETGRIFSIFALPTLYAIICAVLVLFIFHYLIRARGKRNFILWFILLSAGLFNLVLTQSFGGILYLAAGALAYLLLSGILKLKFLAPAVMALLLFLSITVGLRYNEAKEFEPVKLRISNWIQSSRIINAAPLWGVGFGNYESRISHFTKGDEAKSIYAHNFFLQFIAESGMAIPIILLLLLIISRKRLIPRDRGSPGNEEHRENNLYITIFLVLLLYNAVDIGFYFFAAGICGVAVLSQIYRKTVDTTGSTSRLETLRKQAPPVIVLLLLLTASLLLVETLSGNRQKDADFEMSQNRFTEAEPLFKKSLTLNPYNYKALFGLAYLYYSTERENLSRPLLEKGLAIYPDYPFGNYLKSKIAFEHNRYFQAFYHAAAAFQQSPINNRYRDWYLFIKNNLDAGLHQQENQSQGEIR